MDSKRLQKLGKIVEGMQQQDKALYDNLLALRESIRSLKSELKWEREQCERAFLNLGDFASTDFEDDVFGAGNDADKGNGFKWKHDRQDSGISVKTPESENPESATAVMYPAQDVNTTVSTSDLPEVSNIRRTANQEYSKLPASSQAHSPELISASRNVTNTSVKTSQAQQTTAATQPALIQHSKQDSGILLDVEEAVSETKLLSKLVESPEMLEKLENRKFDIIIQNKWRKVRDISMAGGFHHQRSRSSNDLLTFQSSHGRSLPHQHSTVGRQTLKNSANFEQLVAHGNNFSDGNSSFKQYKELQQVKEGKPFIPFHSRTNSCPVKSFGEQRDIRHLEPSLAPLHKEGALNEGFKAGGHEQWEPDSEDVNQLCKHGKEKLLNKGLQNVENQQLKPVKEDSVSKIPDIDRNRQFAQAHEKSVGHDGDKNSGKKQFNVLDKEGIEQGFNMNGNRHSNQPRVANQPLKTETNRQVKSPVEKSVNQSINNNEKRQHTTLSEMYGPDVIDIGSRQHNHQRSFSSTALSPALLNSPKSVSISGDISVAPLLPNTPGTFTSSRNASPSCKAVSRQTFMANHRHTKSLPATSATKPIEVADRMQMMQENRCSMQNISACKIVTSTEMRPRRRSASVVDVGHLRACESLQRNLTDFKTHKTIPVQFECLEEDEFIPDLVDPRIRQASFTSNFVPGGKSKFDKVETSREASFALDESFEKNGLSESKENLRNSYASNKETSVENGTHEQSSDKDSSEIPQKARVKQVESFDIAKKSKNKGLTDDEQSISNNSKTPKSSVFRVNGLQQANLRSKVVHNNNSIQTAVRQSEQSDELQMVKPLRAVRVSAGEINFSAIADNQNVSSTCSLDVKAIANKGLRRRFTVTNYETSHLPPKPQPKNAELSLPGFFSPNGHIRHQSIPEYDIIRRRHSTFTLHAPSRSWDGHASRRSNDIKPMARSASYVSLV